MFIFSRRPIIFSVSGKKIMAAKIINGQIKRRRLFWADPISSSIFGGRKKNRKEFRQK